MEILIANKRDQANKKDTTPTGQTGADGPSPSKAPGPLSTKWVVNSCLIILSTVLVIGWAEVFYWKYWPFTPAVVHGKIKVLNPNKEVCAGTNMKYEADITKYMDVPYTVKRQLVNSSLIMYDPVYPPRKPLGRQKVYSDIFVPKRADVAEWFMRHTIEYYVGPGGDRIIPVISVSEKFKVIDCDDLAEKGETGKQGVRGMRGEKGEPGPRGGVSLFGRGDKGPKGDKGDPGKDRK